MGSFYFSRSDTTLHSVNLVLKLVGQDYKSLKHAILKKVVDYNSLIHPKKRDLVGFLFTKSSINKFSKIFFDDE